MTRSYRLYLSLCIAIISQTIRTEFVLHRVEASNNTILPISYETL